MLLRALTQWGTGGFFEKPAATLPLIKFYRMSLISTGSILLDSTFNSLNYRKDKLIKNDIKLLLL
jgi:hypothetical protein